MRKILHKLIRYNRGGINVVADVNAAISTGDDGSSISSVTSYSRVVQRSGRASTEPSHEEKPAKEENHGEEEA